MAGMNWPSLFWLFFFFLMESVIAYLNGFSALCEMEGFRGTWGTAQEQQKKVFHA